MRPRDGCCSPRFLTPQKVSLVLPQHSSSIPKDEYCAASRSRPAQLGCCSRARTSLRSRATASHSSPRAARLLPPTPCCRRVGSPALRPAWRRSSRRPPFRSCDCETVPLSRFCAQRTSTQQCPPPASRTATQSPPRQAEAESSSYRSGRFGVGCTERFVAVSLSLHVIRLIARERKSPMAPRRCSSMQRRLGSRCWRCEPDPRARGRLNTAVRGVRFHHTQ